jgi:uncharacterized protein (DUF362 family)
MPIKNLTKMTRRKQAAELIMLIKNLNKMKKKIAELIIAIKNLLTKMTKGNRAY